MGKENNRTQELKEREKGPEPEEIYLIIEKDSHQANKRKTNN